MIVLGMTFLVTRLLNRALASSRVNQMFIEREKAKELALSGIAIGQALLVHEEKKQQDFFQELFLNLNRWQTFDLDEKVDGVDGQIKIYMSCEDGKLPLNVLWEFEKQQFFTDKNIDVRKLLDGVILQTTGKKQKDKKIVDELERFLKKRDMPLEALSEFLVDDYFKGTARTMFLEPSQKDGKTVPLVLSDIFTLINFERKIQPLFLSAGTLEIFGLKQWPEDVKKRKEIIKPLASKLKNSIEWQKEWDGMLGKLYGKAYNKLPSSFAQLFDSTIGATTISVLSYGKIGTVTQKVYAIIERVVSTDKCVTYAVRKLYWI